MSNIYPARLGGQDKLIILRHRYKLKIGKTIEYRLFEENSKHEKGVITGLEPVLFIAKW